MENFQRIEDFIEEKLNNDAYAIICIDGSCGSGKSTYAKYLEEKYPIDLIQMDDFFLPFELKTEARLATEGGNIHHERFSEEIVPILFSTEEKSYQSYNCKTRTYEKKYLKGHKVKVIEGVYSSHPIFGDIYDYKISLSIDSLLQKERIISRNGLEMWGKFEAQWIPLEEYYFNFFNTFKTSDLHIHIQ